MGKNWKSPTKVLLKVNKLTKKCVLNSTTIDSLLIIGELGYWEVSNYIVDKLPGLRWIFFGKVGHVLFGKKNHSPPTLHCQSLTTSGRSSRFAMSSRNTSKKIQKTCFRYTPQETNMAPENRPLEKEIPIGNHQF